MTRKELRERSGGRDPLVVAMPLLCPACGHVWDAPLSRGTCYLVAALAAFASLLCSAIFVASISLLVWVYFRPAQANKPSGRGVASLITVAGMSLGAAIGAAFACRKYLRRAREQ